MSNPTVPHSSRQHLDELDALLQRMLELPVSDTDEPEAEAPARPQPPASPAVLVPGGNESPNQELPNQEVPNQELPNREGRLGGVSHVDVTSSRPVTRSAAAPAFGPTVRFVPAPVVSEIPDRPPAEAHPPAVTAEAPRDPLAVIRAARPLFEPPAPVLADRQPVPPPVRDRGPTADTGEGERLSPLLWPLAGVTGVFEAVAVWFGPPGRWLIGPVGRNLIGGVGILLVLASLAFLVADWFGWI